MDQQLISEAKNIAIYNLRECYRGGRIIASLDNFSDNWARDTFWAALGAVKIEDFVEVKNSIELFLVLQKEDGKIPRKVALEYTFIKYVFKRHIARKKPSPLYVGLVPPFPSMDDNSLLIIAFAKYAEQAKDLNFLSKHFLRLKKAIDWYENHLKVGLVQEHLLSSWMDTVFKNGAVLYTNVLYVQALKSFALLAQMLGEIEIENQYLKKFEQQKETVSESFWNGKYFDDQKGKSKYFDLAANSLAVVFDIATPRQAEIIANYIICIRNEKKLLPNVVPKYPWWKINPLVYLFGMQAYQNGISWLWIDLFASMAVKKAGRQKDAEEIFEKVAQNIVQNKAVYETLFLDGKPFRSWLWKSAVPFAWNSGVFIFAEEELKK